MREQGTVVGVDGSTARVRMDGGPRCGSCCACAAAGSGEHELEVATAEPLEVGARVVVEVHAPNVALSALLVFVVPLLGLVGGVIAGQRWRPLGLGGDADGLVLGFGLLVLLLAVAAAIDRLVLRARLPEPTVVSVQGKGA